ncbi:glycosyl hydrolase [Aquabacterium sp.]|uniref:glycosyl hydrolase n=1 Tax=Aquabacterium sp. TaxID=1872578 RepID=UPI0025B916AD|nr:glycosyl hydrolase [Aquabacterium sp.]
MHKCAPARLVTLSLLATSFAAQAATIALSDTAPLYNPTSVKTSVYNKTYQESGAVDGDYFGWAVLGKWYNISYCLDEAKTDCPVDNTQWTRVRPPWASVFSADKALKFAPQKLSSDGGGIQYILPLPFALNARYRISMRLGTTPGNANAVHVAMMGKTAWDYAAMARIYDIPANKSYVDVVMNGVFTGADGGAVQADGRTLRLFPQKAGLPIYVDNVKVEVMNADPLNLASDVSAATSAAPLPMDPKMFGLHVNELGSHNAWPALSQEVFRLWGTDGSYWFSVQPTNDPDPSHWNWSQIDYRVNYFKGNNPNGSIIYTLGQSPAWASSNPSQAGCAYGTGVCAPPANDADFKAYVKATAQRYLGKVQYFEIWNEPGWGGFFAGTPAKLASMTAVAKQALREVDPTDAYKLRLIGPAVGGVWLDQYLRAGAGANLDIFNVHQYLSPTTIEADVPAGIANAKLTLQAYGLKLPIWNTESGIHCGPGGSLCPVNYAPSDSVLRGMEPRSLAVQWANGVSNVDYYFMEGWGPAWEGLVKRADPSIGCANTPPSYCTPFMPLQPMGTGFAKAAAWLKNAKLTSAYKMASADIYIFKFTTPAGAKRYLVWTTGTSDQVVTAPSAWAAKTVSDTAGAAVPLATSTTAFTLKSNEPLLISP